ncbi:MAG: hydratase, partial [SAR324 cluster bacterium]|nr:hydratase [SAR324 cluster bacterium]
MRPSLLVSIMLMVAVLVPAMVHAECPSPERVAEAATVYFANELAAAYTGLTVEDAYCAQRRYVALLERRLGPRGGYKVGFTSRVSQEMYGVKEPARGVMFRSMFLESGVVLNANFGKRPFREADLVVKVKDEGINTARTLLEVARHLDEVIPFIELPNMALAKGEPWNVPEGIAYNMGARLGVVG